MLDLSQALQEIDQLSSDIDSATSDVSLTLDIESSVDEVQSEIDGLEAAPVDIVVDADVEPAQSEIDGLEAEPITIPVEPDTEEAQANIDALSESISGLQGAAAGIGAVGLGAALGDVVSEFGEAERVGAIAGQVFENVGASVGVTAGGVQALALSVQEYTGFSDEAVTQAAQVVASFQNITNSADGTVNTFDRTITTSADLAVAMGSDIPAAARTLGRALADPEKAAARLRRAGIILSDDQQALISSFVEVGDVASAQGVILDAIEAKYGGVAEAAGATLTGSLDRAGEAFGNIKEVIGGGAASFLDPLVAGVATLAEGFTGLPTSVQNAVGGLTAFTLAAGTAAGAAVALRAAVGSELVGSLKTAATELRALAASSQLFALLSNPYVAIAGLTLLGGAFLLASGEADGLKIALADLGDSLGTLAAPAIPALRESLAGLELVLETTTSAAEGLSTLTEELTSLIELTPGIDDASGAVGVLFETLVETVIGSIPIIGPIINSLGDFAAMGEDFDKAGDAIEGFGGKTAEGLDEAAAATAAAEAEFQRIINTLPTVADSFDALQSADPTALDEFFQTVNAASDPAVLSANLQAQADALNTWAADLSTVAAEGPAGLVDELRNLGPEAATLTAELATALRDGDVVEAARLAGVISNLQDAQVRVAEAGQGAGSGFTEAAQAAINTGGEAVAAAAQASGDAAAAGIGAGFGTVTALLTAQMGLATATVASGGATLASTAGTVGRNSGNALGLGFASSVGQGVSLGMAIARNAINGQGASLASSARSIGYQVGVSLGSGIASGIGSQVAQIAAQARDAVNQAEAAARAAADSNSPSRLFAAVGRDMGDGLAIGFEQSARALIAEAEAVTVSAAGAVGVGGSTANFGGVNVQVVVQGDASPAMAQGVLDGARSGVEQAISAQRQAFDVRSA